MPALYADIIVDISAGSLDRVFQYKIPDRLRAEVDIGRQVLVPFGKGDKVIKGFVLNITQKPGYDVEKIKEISQVINSELAMESQLIRLAWQMKKVYGGTMNQALKTVIPVKRQVKQKVQKYYRIAKHEEELAAYEERLSRDKRYRARAALLKSIKELSRAPGPEALPAACDRPVALNDLERYGAVSPSALRALVADGILEELSQTAYRSPIKALMPAKEQPVLNTQQQQAANAIIEDEAHQIHLLHGITGSGKTEVYMELIARMLLKGSQVIVLIPEISLSLQTVSRFYSRFGQRVSVMNSRLSDGEKYDQYLRAKRGEIDIVVGPRSALFMPFERLGMIIIDEEHDGAYKSENTPRFHARDVAIWRAKMAGAKVVLGSATPSMESYARALSGMYGLHTLDMRAREGSLLPTVTVVDLREEFKLKNKKIFSRRLCQLMEETLARGEQIILFLNRRGYAGFVSCRSCGHVFKCRHCEISMTAHRGGWLKCHYCGYEQPLPKLCPECGSPYVAAFGTGTQKVEQMIGMEFPNARVLRLDRDSTARKDSMEEILEKFRKHEADILVGTQMIVKGHDFPGVTLVGILAADLSMFSSDYMAAERTFDLLTQAAGRSGRDGKPGQVVIQTYQPEHYSISCASRQDYKSFYRQEMNYRRLLKYPPVVHMMVVLVTGRDESRVGDYIRLLAKALRTFCAEAGIEGMELIGPGDASVSRGMDIYRKVFYLKNKKFPYMIEAREFMERHLRTSSYIKDVSLQFDINPMSMY
ncbi:MAG: primosomal protein N' [Clostridiales bacterium]|nr:primosomal protein N' [Clostridiales bacterium]